MACSDVDVDDGDERWCSNAAPSMFSANKGGRTVKGSHVVQAREYIDGHLGPGTFTKYTAHGGDSWSIILPVVWYDIDILYDALAKASEELRVSIEDITARIARLNAEKDLTSIYRFFLRAAQPHRVLAHTPKLWTTYVSFGSAKAIKNEPGHYLGQGDGFDEKLVGWGSGCWRGFIPATIEVAGGRDLNSRIVRSWRAHDGTYSVQFEVNYV
jgi:hypothetical protein